MPRRLLPVPPILYEDFDSSTEAPTRRGHLGTLTRACLFKLLVPNYYSTTLQRVQGLLVTQQVCKGEVAPQVPYETPQRLPNAANRGQLSQSCLSILLDNTHT